jgi:hypothetical protein
MISRILICAVALLQVQHQLGAAQINSSEFKGGTSGSAPASNQREANSFQDQAPVGGSSSKDFPRTNYLNEPDRRLSALESSADSAGASLPSNQDGLTVGRISDNKLYLDNCTAQFIDDIEVPARESGQIIRMDVKEGDPIKSLQVLAQLDDELMRVALKRAEQAYENALIKANDKTSIAAATNEEQLAKIKLNRTAFLHGKGSAPLAEYEMAQFEYKLAVLKIELAEMTRRESEGEARIELAQIDEVKTRIQRHQAFVDFDGYVIELLKHKMEWANVGEPIMRVGRMDRLAVVALVSTQIANPFQIRKGQPVTVTLAMAGGKMEQFQGKISQVSLTREAGEVIKIKAELDNRKIDEENWLLQPYSSVEMVVELR